MNNTFPSGDTSCFPILIYSNLGKRLQRLVGIWQTIEIYLFIYYLSIGVVTVSVTVFKVFTVLFSKETQGNCWNSTQFEKYVNSHHRDNQLDYFVPASVVQLVRTSIMRVVMSSIPYWSEKLLIYLLLSVNTGLAKWFGSHNNKEVRLSSAVKCKKGPQFITSLLNQRRNYYYYFVDFEWSWRARGESFIFAGTW